MQTQEAVGKARAEQYTEQNSAIFTQKNGKVKEEEKKLWLWDFAKWQLLVVLAERRNESQLEEIQKTWSNLR